MEGDGATVCLAKLRANIPTKSRIPIRGIGTEGNPTQITGLLGMGWEASKRELPEMEARNSVRQKKISQKYFNGINRSPFFFFFFLF